MKYYNFPDYERTINKTVNIKGLRNRCLSIANIKVKVNNNKGSIFKLAYKVPTYYRLYKNCNQKFKNCC